MQDAFRKKLLQDAENEEDRKDIKQNLKSIEQPAGESKLMNRFKLNAARKSEKAKGLMTNDNPALKSAKSINKQPMNRAGSVDLTPFDDPDTSNVALLDQINMTSAGETVNPHQNKKIKG